MSFIYCKKAQEIPNVIFMQMKIAVYKVNFSLFPVIKCKQTVVESVIKLTVLEFPRAADFKEKHNKSVNKNVPMMTTHTTQFRKHLSLHVFSNEKKNAERMESCSV